LDAGAAGRAGAGDGVAVQIERAAGGERDGGGEGWTHEVGPKVCDLTRLDRAAARGEVERCGARGGQHEHETGQRAPLHERSAIVSTGRSGRQGPGQQSARRSQAASRESTRPVRKASAAAAPPTMSIWKAERAVAAPT